MDIKHTSLLILIYIAALTSLSSFAFFCIWAISVPDLLINGFESIGLDSPSPESLWKEQLLFNFITGIFGWVSLFVLFIQKNKPINLISPIWLVGISGGIYTSLALNISTPVFSYPPIILSISLLALTYLNKPNKRLWRQP